jgi:hypothetical protein
MSFIRDCSTCKFQYPSFGMETCTHSKAAYTIEQEINGVTKKRIGQHSCTHTVKFICGSNYSLHMKKTE